MLKVALCPHNGDDSRDAIGMYYTHWGLDRPPFATGDAQRSFFQGAPQREAVSRLQFLVAQQRRGGLLLGARGTGKSLLLQNFSRQCRLAGHAAAYVSVAGITPRELTWQVASQFDAGPNATDDVPRLYRRLADFARGAPARGTHAVLLLDDVDQAGADCLTHLLRILDIETAQPWLTAIVTSASGNSSRVGTGLLDKLDLRIELEPWEVDETAEFLQFALFQAGSRVPLFDEAALVLIHEMAGGVPRQVIRLAEHALLAAAGTGSAWVDVGLVESALEELRWTAFPA
jgi:type II secretory pathway predicted ATPase ExeA